MITDDRERGTGPWRVGEAGLIALGVAVGLVPYLGRLRHPTLYTDDVVRIAQLQTSSLGRLLFLPFNEHMAPLFQGLSWLTWKLIGGRLSWAPLAFTIVSYLPFVLSLGLLARVLRAETEDETRPVATPLAGLAVFSLSWLASETVYWYSASSFMWALAGTLAAWLGGVAAVAKAESRGRPWRGAIGMALASAMAPAFSAIGLLAGPLAVLRCLVGGERVGVRRRLALALAPVAGTTGYLAVCSWFRYGEVLNDSLARNVHLGTGLAAALRAPLDYLVPGLFLAWQTPVRLGQAPALGLSILGTLGLLAWCRWGSGSHSRRGLILGGLVLIFGGYALPFCARGDHHGRAVLVAQRYHLFPQLGLVFVLTPALGFLLRRREARPRAALAVAGSLALALGLIHAPMLKARGKSYRFPDQAQTLAALDRLGALCRASGTSRAEALAALDPISPAWSPPGYNALEMLAETVETDASGHPRGTEAVRARLLAALTPAEREALCGGMDASSYLQPLVDHDRAATGRLRGEFRLRADGPGRWVTAGWPSYLEYELPPTAAPHTPIRAIGLPLEMPGGSIEVWWRGDHETWSETRSVHCRLDPAPPSSPDGRGWSLPTDRLPHWRPGRSLHLRIFFRTPGVVVAEAPVLLR